MPTYVYECKKCEKTIEVEQRMSEAPLTDCDCGEEGTLRRLIQPTAIMFRGSGFHINDYSSGTSKPAASEPACSGNPPTCQRCASDSEA